MAFGLFVVVCLLDDLSFRQSVRLRQISAVIITICRHSSLRLTGSVQVLIRKQINAIVKTLSKNKYRVSRQQPASMRMNRCSYLISRGKKFSNAISFQFCFWLVF